MAGAAAGGIEGALVLMALVFAAGCSEVCETDTERATRQFGGQMQHMIGSATVGLSTPRPVTSVSALSTFGLVGGDASADLGLVAVQDRAEDAFSAHGGDGERAELRNHRHEVIGSERGGEKRGSQG